jgi:spermidine synthase
MLFHAVTIFLSAFLLFQVQPVIARVILPWFGGTAAVWTTCLLFFQVTLLLGYAYSHFVIRRLSPRRQLLVHAALLLLCLLLLPITPDTSWKPSTADNPTLRILGLLAATIGLPYFLLSTTGPLVQAWFVQANPGATPYRLFALSNLGSMVALLSYPILVEPRLALRTQTLAWSTVFAVFIAICGYTGYRSTRGAGAVQSAESVEAPPAPASFGRHVLWVLLAACPSMLLLSFTTHLTVDVAPIPFLWILPLALYLLTFILCFDADGWYRRTWFLCALGPCIGLIVYLTDNIPADYSEMAVDIGLMCVGFFVCCMVCHGELSRLKPHPRLLTGYFLMISVGGALGGAVVAIAAPYWFQSNYELPLSLIFCTLLAATVVLLDGPVDRRTFLCWRGLAVLLGVPLLSGFTLFTFGSLGEDTIFTGRNFYSALRVKQVSDGGELEQVRALKHGRVEHGSQFMHLSRRRQLTNYYCPDCGLGLVMAARQPGVPSKAGIVGLGAGTMAAYARPGDEFKFYEINPMILDIARNYFTFLKDCQGKVSTSIGDARLLLEREPPQNYDILAVDAFSSDSIPVHLLTSEAIELYFSHLKPDGVLAVHITNHYLNLEPVLERAANHLGKQMFVVRTTRDDDNICYRTRWALLSSNTQLFHRPEFATATRPAKAANFVRWTDDYSNLFSVLQ